MNRQRPYRDRSPYRQAEEFHAIKQVLQSDLSMLQEQNALLKIKCIKVSELQEKVDMVLKQNAQLLAENQKMARILHQQKVDNQSMRNKVESLSAQKVSFAHEFDIERSKLMTELDRVRDAMNELELKKNNQISELKSNQQVEIQGLKRQINQIESSSEHEIRKFKEQLEKKERDIDDYINKLKRLTSQTDYQILKLKDEKEKLKAQISYNEADHHKEVDVLRSKLEKNYLEELQALKRAHIHSLEEAERQNIRLRDTVNERNREIDQITSKGAKQKQAADDHIHYLKKDNEALKNKIIQIQQAGHFELHRIRENLTHFHQTQIQELMMRQEGQIKRLEQQIDGMKTMIQAKNNEIEQLIKEKVTNRNLFDAEMGKVKDDYAMVLQKYKDQEIKLAEVNNQSSIRLNDREKHIEYLQNLLKDQKTNSENEIHALQKSLEALRKEHDSEKMLFQEKEQKYKEQIADLQHQLQQTKLNADHREAELERKIKSLKGELEGTSANLNSKAQGLHAKNRALEKENQALKNSLNNKENEIKKLSDRLKTASQRQARLEAQIDDIRNKLIQREKRSNQNISDQKARLQASYANALESMKADYEAAMKLESNKLRDLQQKLKKKDAELEELLKMYKKMTEQIQVLTEQEANKKDITLKFPGATADLIASKNLFDIYLKTKVLDVCGDALKENR